jgi:hypothetical protein
MVLVGHSKHQAKPLTPGQRKAMRAVGAIIVVTAATVVVWLSVTHTGVAESRHGCVSVIVAGATGGNLLRQCGAAARVWCKSEFTKHDPLALRIQQQCRIAGVKSALVRDPAEPGYT